MKLQAQAADPVSAGCIVINVRILCVRPDGRVEYSPLVTHLQIAEALWGIARESGMKPGEVLTLVLPDHAPYVELLDDGSARFGSTVNPQDDVRAFWATVAAARPADFHAAAVTP